MDIFLEEDADGTENLQARRDRLDAAASRRSHCPGDEDPDVVRTIGVTQVTYYRWRREFGGLQLDQVRRMKELEQENQRLRRAVSDLTLDKLILAEAAKGNF